MQSKNEYGVLFNLFRSSYFSSCGNLAAFLQSLQFLF
jgi:hypothetical protein